MIGGFDPFFAPHPSLNHRRVEVEAFVLDEPIGYPLQPSGSGVTRRRIDWNRLTLDERLELERLLAKACVGEHA